MRIQTNHLLQNKRHAVDISTSKVKPHQLLKEKQQAHVNINHQVEDFLKHGGKIETVQQGITGHQDLHTDKTYRKH